MSTTFRLACSEHVGQARDALVLEGHQHAALALLFDLGPAAVDHRVDVAADERRQDFGAALEGHESQIGARLLAEHVGGDVAGAARAAGADADLPGLAFA